MPTVPSTLIKDFLKVAVPLAAVLAVLAPFLPGLHVAVGAIAVVSAVSGVLNALISWAQAQPATQRFVARFKK